MKVHTRRIPAQPALALCVDGFVGVAELCRLLVLVLVLLVPVPRRVRTMGLAERGSGTGVPLLGALPLRWGLAGRPLGHRRGAAAALAAAALAAAATLAASAARAVVFIVIGAAVSDVGQEAECGLGHLLEKCPSSSVRVAETLCTLRS